MAILSRALLAVAIAAFGASAKTVTLNFDDISVSNADACGLKVFDQKKAYSGFLVTADSELRILNGTKTEKCKSWDDWQRPFAGWSTSGSNVIYNGDGSVQFTSKSGNVKKATFDVDVIFTEGEIGLNSTVRIGTSFSTGSEDDKIYVFHTLKDGFGPYHIETATSGPFSWVNVEAQAIEPIGEGPTINTDLTVDTAVFELA
ncbi:hypothetical protein PT974_04462 [Cladobotryum mycophilum]|uniref:Uncharacterized protein n=1 Tax=Cladobotryum mycophilum TaxID=491253 RepID=A0ABR0SV60_9HYPO